MIDYDFISKKHTELIESDDILILIKPRDYDRFDVIEFIRLYEDARAFQTNFNDENIIFIKKVKFIKDFDYKRINREADKAFTTHNTDKAIELYEKILLIKKPGIHVYARLGLLYLAKNNINQALIYLKIATGFSLKTRKKKYDFTALINKITKHKEKDEETKRYFTMNISDFKNYLAFDYDTRIKEVIILIEFHEMNLEEACRWLNIREEEKNIIILYLARDCYARNDLEYGDKLYRLVEKSSIKSDMVIRFMKELRTNRLFYQNRVDENYKPLIRSRIKTS